MLKTVLHWKIGEKYSQKKIVFTILQNVTKQYGNNLKCKISGQSAYQRYGFWKFVITHAQKVYMSADGIYWRIVYSYADNPYNYGQYLNVGCKDSYFCGVPVLPNANTHAQDVTVQHVSPQQTTCVLVSTECFSWFWGRKELSSQTKCLRLKF